jgi:hypothetical protein
MEDIPGVVLVEFLTEDGKNCGSQYGLMMSHYDQTIIFTPFDINKNHFTHSKIASCSINNKIMHLNNSRYSYPFLLRVWTLPLGVGINPSTELTINCPNKKHSIYGSDNKIDNIEDININFWHCKLPPFLAHEIIGKYPIGTVTYYNNKPTGIIVKYYEEFGNKSIIVNTYTMKQITVGLDYYYSGIYYNFKMSENKDIYIAEDWDLYDNCLKKNDIVLSIDNVPIGKEMYYNKLSKDLYIDTWITVVFMEKDNDSLECKIIRDNKHMTVNIPRKPLNEYIQIPYYSSDDSKMSLETFHTNKHIERFYKFGYELMKSPKKFFV